MNNLPTTNGHLRDLFMLLFPAIVLCGIFYIGGKWLEVRPPVRLSMTAQGQAKLFAAPDTAELTIGVETGRQSNADEAINILAKKINAILTQLKDLGIEEKDIKTTGLSLFPAYDYFEGQQKPKGFEANQTVLVTVRDITKVGKIVSATTNVGTNRVNGVRFYIDDEMALRKTIRLEAIEKAQEDAEVLASEVGKKLGALTSFNVDGSQPIVYYPTFQKNNAENLSVPAGEQELIVNVSLTYNLR